MFRFPPRLRRAHARQTFLEGGEKARKFDKLDYLLVISFENGTIPRPVKVRNKDGELDVEKIKMITEDDVKQIVADGDFRNIFYEIITTHVETETHYDE